MLKTVRLKNFQSHKETTVDLVNGVNTFIGTSDHGKSSIMRAINLVAENKPDGTGYVSHWAFNSKGKIAEDTEVELHFDDVTVKRIKGVDNAYLINEEEYRAFGKQAPDEVKDAVNFYDVNVQRQEQNFFLFSETSGEVIRRINGYVNLDIIDTALTKADKDARDNKSAIKTNKAQTEDIVDKLKPYDVIEDLEALHEKATETVDRKKQAHGDRLKVEDYTKKLKRTYSLLEKYKSVDRISRRIAKVESSAESLKQLREKRSALIKAADRYRTIASKIDSLVTSADLSEAFSVSEQLDEVGDKIDRIRKKIVKHSSVDEEWSRVTMKIDKLHEEYHEQMGDTCPLCGSKVKE